MTNHDVENRNESCYNDHVGEMLKQVLERVERTERINGL